MVERTHRETHMGLSYSEAKEKSVHSGTTGVMLSFTAIDSYACKRHVL